MDGKRIKKKKKRNERKRKKKEISERVRKKEKKKKNRKRKEKEYVPSAKGDEEGAPGLKTVPTKQKAEHREKRLSIARIVFYVGTGFK